MQWVQVHDRNRNGLAILENAINITERQVINNLSFFEFSLPENDTKNGYCEYFNLIRLGDGAFYRIVGKSAIVDDNGHVQYRCEHVAAQLIADIMPFDHIRGGWGQNTRSVLEYILSFQSVRNWRLGACEFNFFFEYLFTDENLFTAMLSVADIFADSYMFEFDTSVYPYVINLRRLDKNIIPQMHIMRRKNQLRTVNDADLSMIATEIHPRGYGEGNNALTIESVNGGVPFLRSPQHIIDRYGVIKFPWRDRRFENPESLMNAARAKLEAMQEPFESFEVDFALTDGAEENTPRVGKLVDIVGFRKLFITRVEWKYEDIPRAILTLATNPRDTSNGVAEIMHRQRIEMTYAQGATQFWQNHWYDNADQNHPLILKVFFPSDLRIINKVRMNVEISSFRMPFRVTEGGGARTETSGPSSLMSSGSSSRQTTFDGGGATSGASSIFTTDGGNLATSGPSSASTTDSGGQITSGASSENTTQGGGVVTGGASSESTTQSGGNTTSGVQNSQLTLNIHPATVHWTADAGSATHTHGFLLNVGHTHNVPGHTHGMAHTHLGGNHTHGMAHTHSLETHFHNMWHTHSMQPHSHGMWHTHDIFAHSHNMEHTHNIEHTHNLTLPDHEHTLIPGMARAGNPTSFLIRINGIDRQIVYGRFLERSVIEWLVSGREIPRNRDHIFEIIPNSPAYVMLTVNVQGFIQSTGGQVS